MYSGSHLRTRAGGGIAGCDMCAVLAGVRAALVFIGTDACRDVCGGDGS